MTKEQIYQKEYYLKNKEKLLGRENYHKLYYLKNKETIKEKTKKWASDNKEKRKIYLKNNKEKIKETSKKYQKERRSNDNLFKLRGNISSLINISIKKQGYSKKSKTFEYLGCTLDKFKQHLEIQFIKGMNWDNIGEWHLDHIFPVSLAKDEDELIRLNHYTNFQPLWAEDNLKKGNKIIEKQLILI